jgi:hypothetical protein
MANMASEWIRVSQPVKADFILIQESLVALKGRLVTQSEVVEELLRVYRHVAEEAAP